MSNYTTSETESKSLIKFTEELNKALDYLLNLKGIKFVLLNNKKLPIKAYKNEDPISRAEIMAGLNKFGFIGLVPKSIGLWVFVKSNKLCQFKDKETIFYRDEQGWLQLWYVGTIYKSLNPYRCYLDLEDNLAYCGRVIQQYDYITLTAKDLIKLANKLIDASIFNSEGSLISTEEKPETLTYHQQLSAKHIKDRQRLYKDLSPKEMLAVARNAHGYNLYPIMRALILEMAVREHKNIKADKLDKKYLELILDKLLDETRETITLNQKEQDKIIDNALNFAKNRYLSNRPPPARHLEWINLYKQGINKTAISSKYNVDRSTVSKALKKYGYI